MTYPKYYVYLLKCSDGSFYTGCTEDLKLRLKEHNGELIGGAKYTKSRRPVELMHFEVYHTRKEAERREKEIKRLDRTDREIICDNGNRNLE